MEKHEGKALDLSHHLSEVSKRRGVSPLKGIFKYIERNPNILSMAGGVPSPEYFPYANLSADVLVPRSYLSGNNSTLSWLWSLLGVSNDKPKTTHITVPKYATNPEEVNLAVSLQYGTAAGILPLQKFVRNFVAQVYQPAYSDFATLLHVGNTDGWGKVVIALMNPGEGLLCEEWTYPSALFMSQPFGVTPVPVKADSQGMMADDLEHVLANWDEPLRGMKRPHVLYTIPAGQNPTGANMLAPRKKDIYDICVKYDVIIVEDDPYYFLQQLDYKPKSVRQQYLNPALTEEEANTQFINSLAPSFVRFDYQGRVIRLDTFSKTIAPGSRLGFLTCNPIFAERIERQAETTTQGPSGFTQSLVAHLLIQEWTFGGYIVWLRGLQLEYTLRRDAMMDALMEQFYVERGHASGVWSDLDVYTAYGIRSVETPAMLRSEKSDRKALLTFVPPKAGMFIWFKVHVESLPGLKTSDDPELDTKEKVLWIKLADAGLLVGPGYVFAADTEDERIKTEAHFRLSFSTVDNSTMTKAAKIIAKVLHHLRKA